MYNIIRCSYNFSAGILFLFSLCVCVLVSLSAKILVPVAYGKPVCSSVVPRIRRLRELPG